MTEDAVRKLEIEQEQAPPEMFDGDVRFDRVHQNSERGVNQLRVHFHDGARTHWHVHMDGQILYFVDGDGFAQEHGREVIECGAGDIVEVPKGTRHIHGAMPGSNAVHIAVSQGKTIWDHEPDYPG